MPEFLNSDIDYASNGEIRRESYAYDGGVLRRIASHIPLSVYEAIHLPHYLLYHIVEGEKTFYSGKSTWTVSAGSSFLMRRQAVLSCEANLSGEYPFSAPSLHIDRVFIDRFLREFPQTIGQSSPLKNACILPPQPQLNSAIALLNSHFSTGAQVWSELICHHVKGILLLLFSGEHALECQAVCAEAFFPRRRAYLELVESSIECPLSTEAMAEHMQMSLSAFKREFKQLFQQTPARFLLLRRLERAQQMLLTCSFPLAQIAAATGFEK